MSTLTAVVHALRTDAQTVNNAQVTAYFKSKHEPATLVQHFVQFDQDARNDGPQDALITIGVPGLFGFVMNCFLPSGRSKKPEAGAPRAPAS